MSRYSHEIDRDEAREHSTTAPRNSRAGGGTANSSTELVALIDQAAANGPTMAQFMDRLESRGVRPVPSVNARGLNGMSYVFRGEVIRGSDLGRAYTAHGLQQRKGVDYSVDRDAPAIAKAVERTQGVVRAQEVDRGSETRRSGGRTRDRETGLSVDQRATLTEIGMFRAIEVRDLVQHGYGGRGAEFEADFRVLRAAGLVERANIEHPKSGRVYNVIVLSRAGRNAAKRLSGGGSDQQFYSGFVKPAEVRHDVGIYRMYQQERAVIETGGGTIMRIVTDFEIKRRLMSELNRRGEDPQNLSRKREIGLRHDISVVNGRFVIPDLRVEFEARDGQLSRVDLELATRDYKAGQIAAKRLAGIKIYGPDSASGGTPREPYDRGVAMSI